MEDSGIEDGGEQNCDNKNSEKSSSPSDSPAKISNLDELIQILDEQKRNSNQIRQHSSSNNINNSCGNLNLLPIERLSIPGVKDKQPLVQWDSDESEEDIINFFPMKESKMKNQEITDTFSIEEMSISEGEDEDDEEDLHLIPPQTEFANLSCCQCFQCVLL